MLAGITTFVTICAEWQALTKMALVGLEKKRNSPVSKLAMWGVTNLVEQSAAYCYAVEQAGMPLLVACHLQSVSARVE